MVSRPRIALIALGLLLVASVLLRLCAQSASLAWPQDPVILEIRAHRIAIAATVGAALSLAGLALQALLRNPLASPDLLGLASGAGLGVTCSYFAGHLAGLGSTALYGTTTPAILGSFITLGATYLLAQRRGLLDPVPLILLGVIVSILCSAGTMLLQSLLPDGGLETRRWLLGSLREDAPTLQLWLIAVASVAGLAWLVRTGRAMDAASLGDDEAASVGVRLGALRISLFLIAGLLTAGSVMLAGPVGFVGLVCPHVARLLAGPSHRALAVCSALAGAALVVLADVLVRVVEPSSGRLPIGVLTALLGGPVFILLLRREVRASRAGAM
ncbi:MAG: iron ABC transporter permease [Phycisphaeraceae bacterium]|nr:iron ABC transporter permease [Phycisphaeraceae bacterium]